ncbi:MAG: hypothetical protein JO111_08645 [Caulobacteraceae bacterium]|nr:hypothetical protein [Caulobacteraceae bacterium]
MSIHADLTKSPEFYPLALSEDGKIVDLLRLAEADYESASFLDQRLLTQGFGTTRMSWADVSAAAATLPVELDFIFHIGHVGSTLLARLLGRHPTIFALREPALLRQLAITPDVPDPTLRPIVALLSRTWREGQRSLVKATSFVSEGAPVLMSMASSARAVLMLVRPEAYLAGILGGEATLAELPGLTAARADRLSHRQGGGEVPRAASPGEMAALAWACEASGLLVCAEGFAGRSDWFDFDRFLLDPRNQLARAFGHLRGDAGPQDLAAMLSGSEMMRYSKAPEYPFSAAVRGQVLRQSRQTWASEIARGLRWLEAIARSSPLIARTMETAEQVAAH